MPTPGNPPVRSTNAAAGGLGFFDAASWASNAVGAYDSSGLLGPGAVSQAVPPPPVTAAASPTLSAASPTSTPMQPRLWAKHPTRTSSRPESRWAVVSAEVERATSRTSELAAARTQSRERDHARSAHSERSARSGRSSQGDNARQDSKGESSSHVEMAVFRRELTEIFLMPLLARFDSVERHLESFRQESQGVLTDCQERLCKMEERSYASARRESEEQVDSETHKAAPQRTLTRSDRKGTPRSGIMTPRQLLRAALSSGSTGGADSSNQSPKAAMSAQDLAAVSSLTTRFSALESISQEIKLEMESLKNRSTEHHRQTNGQLQFVERHVRSLSEQFQGVRTVAELELKDTGDLPLVPPVTTPPNGQAVQARKSPVPKLPLEQMMRDRPSGSEAPKNPISILAANKEKRDSGNSSVQPGMQVHSEDSTSKDLRFAFIDDRASIDDPERAYKDHSRKRHMGRSKTWYQKDFEDENLHALHCALGLKNNDENVVEEQHTWLHKFSRSPHWHLWCTFVAIINAAMIGVETHIKVRDVLTQALAAENNQYVPPSGFDPVPFNVFDWFFFLWIVLEISLNIYAQRGHFFTGRDCKWNCFDLIILVASIIEIIANSFDDYSFLKALRVFKVSVRMGKIGRAIRATRFLHGVRKMVISLIGSLVTTFWAFFLIFIIMYIVGIILLSGISEHAEAFVKPFIGVDLGAEDAATSTTSLPPRPWEVDENATTWQELWEMYGGLVRCLKTLFQSISGGDWPVYSKPIEEIDTSYGILFYAYMASMLYSVLNVLTGIFVDAAFQAANVDREVAIQEQLDEQEQLAKAIRGVFIASDKDGSGQLTESEFEKLVGNRELVAHLMSLGIQANEAKGLFKLLDDDDSGMVGIEEFVTGCLRLKGGAKAVDMVTLMYEHKKMTRRFGYLYDVMANLCDHLGVDRELRHDLTFGSACASQDRLDRGSARS